MVESYSVVRDILVLVWKMLCVFWGGAIHYRSYTCGLGEVGSVSKRCRRERHKFSADGVRVEFDVFLVRQIRPEGVW